MPTTRSSAKPLPKKAASEAPKSAPGTPSKSNGVPSHAAARATRTPRASVKETAKATTKAATTAKRAEGAKKKRDARVEQARAKEVPVPKKEAVKASKPSTPKRAESTKRKREEPVEESPETEPVSDEIVDWRKLGFVGVEPDSIPSVLAERWSFPELERELRTGELASKPYPLYLWMTTQPVDLSSPFGSGAPNIISLPVIFVIDCSIPPSGRIAVASIQSAVERIEPGERLHMTYEKYPSTHTAAPKHGIFSLRSSGRQARRKNLSEIDVHQESLFIPYELLPQEFEKKSLEELTKEVTNVTLKYKASTKKQFEITWDKDCMNLQDDIGEILETHKLPETERPLIKDALKAAFNKKRADVTEKYNSQKEELARFTPQQLLALRSLRVYKFYPSHPTIDLRPFMVADVNRYYGKAYKVFPELPDMLADAKALLAANAGKVITSSSAATPTTTASSVSTSNNNHAASAPTAGFVFQPSSAPASAASTSSFSVPTGFIPPSSASAVGFTPTPSPASEPTGFTFGLPAANSAPAPSAFFAPSAAPSSGGFSMPAAPASFAPPAAAPAASGFTAPSFAVPTASSFSVPSFGASAPAAAGGFVFSTDFAAATEKYFGAPSSAPLAPGSWKCACCERANPANAATCADCLVPKPN